MNKEHVLTLYRTGVYEGGVSAISCLDRVINESDLSTVEDFIDVVRKAKDILTKDLEMFKKEHEETLEETLFLIDNPQLTRDASAVTEDEGFVEFLNKIGKKKD